MHRFALAALGLGAVDTGQHVHVGPGSVTVDDLIAAVPDILRQLFADAENVVPGHNLRGNAQLAGLFGEGTVPEADQLGGNGFVQMLEEAQDVSLGSAGVASADEMDNFHSVPSFEKRAFARNPSCTNSKNIIQ